jgi:hypothetical protein
MKPTHAPPSQLGGQTVHVTKAGLPGPVAGAGLGARRIQAGQADEVVECQERWPVFVGLPPYRTHAGWV